MDCFRILLLFLLVSSCSTNCCCIAEQSCTVTGPADSGSDAFEPPDTVIEYGQTPPYSFPPYPVLRE